MNLLKTTMCGLPVEIPAPPEKIKCQMTKKWFTPLRYGIPKQGEYSWNLDLLAFGDEPVITFNFCDGRIPSWIYEEIE